MSAANNSLKLNGQKMRDLADYVKSEIPGCGFAIIAFEVENGPKVGNYVSNVQDEFMIKALETQLNALKRGKTFKTPEVETSQLQS
ncbi:MULTISPECIES: hypothetical protein [unclassified Mucilaginibacter]|uniref:hypothetical protein n=1 Tax=unclassified Mucilaginibacter TaxID=2617802 RepID=UPI0031F71A7C